MRDKLIATRFPLWFVTAPVDSVSGICATTRHTLYEDLVATRFIAHRSVRTQTGAELDDGTKTRHRSTV